MQAHAKIRVAMLKFQSVLGLKESRFLFSFVLQLVVGAIKKMS
jgi:hypothetical protein